MGPGVTSKQIAIPSWLTWGRDPWLAVRHLSGTPKIRSVYTVVGCALDIGIGVHNNNCANIVRALVERVYCVRREGNLVPTPRPVDGAFSNRLERFRSLLCRTLPKATPIERDQFPLLYVGRRRTVYEAAVLSLSTQAVSRRDAMIKAFVKAEKVLGALFKDPAPRLIQPRDPRYNVELGVFLKTLEKKVYAAIARVFGEVTVLKGYNAFQTGAIIANKWSKFRRPVGVGLDASRFDQHVSLEALRWEHGIYLSCFKGGDRHVLNRLLQWQCMNRGRAYVPDGIIKYRTEGCRMSGDMNTAMGNCLLMCAMVHAYLESCGVMASLCNNGDDCLLICEQDDLDQLVGGGRLESWFSEMGFTMKVEEPVFELEACEFCQAKPVQVDGDYVMCRDIRKALAKDTHSVLPLSQGKVAYGYCTSIADCGLALCSGMPVFQEFYLMLRRLGKGVRLGPHPGLESGFLNLSKGMVEKPREVSPATRFSFWKAYNVTPDEQVCLERHFKCHSVDLAQCLPREMIDQSFPHLL